MQLPESAASLLTYCAERQERMGPGQPLSGCRIDERPPGQKEAGSALMPLRALSRGDLGQLPRRPGTGAGREGTGQEEGSFYKQVARGID